MRQQRARNCARRPPRRSYSPRLGLAGAAEQARGGEQSSEPRGDCEIIRARSQQSSCHCLARTFTNENTGLRRELPELRPKYTPANASLQPRSLAASLCQPVPQDLAGKLQIRSYPTVIILDGEGREIRRSLGFQGPQEMLKFLKS